MPVTPIVFALLLARHGAVQGAVTLRFHPPVGKTYQFAATTNMSMEMSGGHAMAPMTMGTKMDEDMKILSRTG